MMCETKNTVCSGYQKAFTLIEVVVTIIVIGAIASLAAVSYQRMMIIQSIKRLRTDLLTFHAAQVMYLSKTGTNFKISCADTDNSTACTEAINDQLGVQINMNNDVKYNLFFTAGIFHIYFTLRKVPQCRGSLRADQPISATNPRFFTACPYAGFLK